MSKPSLRKAINDKCKECIYDEFAPGTWRKQIEECTDTNCPLYELRPKTTPKKRRLNETK